MHSTNDKVRLNYSIIKPDRAPWSVYWTELEAGTIVSTINCNPYKTILGTGWETAVLTRNPKNVIIVGHTWDFQYVEKMHRRTVEQLITTGKIDDTITYYGTRTYNAN